MSLTDLSHKRIAFVANSAWSMYNFRKEVLTYFLSSGAKVYVITPPDDHVPLLAEIGCRHYAVHFDNRSTNITADIRLYFSLKKCYELIQPHFIFHYVAKPNIYGSIAAHRLGIPSIAIVTGLGFAFARKNWLYRMVKNLYRLAFRFPAEVWFLNRDDAERFKRIGVIKRTTARVMPGEGIDTDFYHPLPRVRGNRVFQFIMTSRLLKSKGITEFVKAIQALQKSGVACEGVLLGKYDPEHPDTIEPAFFEKIKSNSVVKYLGYQDDVRSFLNAADCFVFPSYYHEGIPRSLMEAAAMELPVITTQHTGCKEVVMDGENGWLVKPQSLKDLIKTMRFATEQHPALLKTMGEVGRQHIIEQFSLPYIIEHYDRVVRKYL